MNLRFLTCVICCIVLAFTPIGIVYGQTTAETTVTVEKSDATYEKASFLLHELNIDKNIPMDKTAIINRGQYTAIAVNAIGVEQNAANIVSGFSDVPESHPYASAISTAKTIGMISGNGGLFMPESNITYVAAFKIALNAMGYKYRAEIKGGYPIGYLALASEIGLTKGIKADFSGDINARDCAVLMYNMLTTDMMIQIGFGESIQYEIYKNRNLLTENFRLFKAEGIVNSVDIASLTDVDKKTQKGKIEINGNLYNAPDYARKLLGNNVIAYCKNDNGNNVAICIIPNKNIEISLKSQDIYSFEDNKLKYTTADNDKILDYDINKSFDVIYNGKAFKDYTTDTFTNISGSLRLLDNDADGDYDVIFIYDYTYVLLSSIDFSNKVLYDANNEANIINIGDDCDYTISILDEDELSNIELEDLTQGMLLSCTVSKDNKLVDITIAQKSVDGTITSIDDDYIYIDDKPYYTNKYYENNYSNIALGSSGTFVLGLDNTITAYIGSASAYKYGWLIKMGNNKAIEPKIQVKLLTQEGKVEILYISNRMMLDGVSKTADNAQNNVVRSLFIDNNGKTNRQLIKYTLNSAGEINKIDTAVTSFTPFSTNLDDNNSLSLYFTANTEYKFKALGSAGKFFSPSFNISDLTYSFLVPSDEALIDNDDQYAVLKSNYFVNDTNYKVDAYDVDISGTAKAIVYKTNNSAIPIDTTSNSAIIDKVVSCVDKDGLLTSRIYLWSNGRFSSVIVDEDIDIASYHIDSGDVIRYNVDSNQKLTNLILDFDYSSQSVVDSTLATNEHAILKYVFGQIYSHQNNLIYLAKKDTGSDTFNYQLNSLKNYSLDKVKIVMYDTSSKTIRPATISDITDYKTAGDDASCLLLRQRYYESSFAVIYK